MPENNTNNLNKNSIKQNINCHSQCDDQNPLLQHEYLNYKILLKENS
jgi:hypothetical protein